MPGLYAGNQFSEKTNCLSNLNFFFFNFSETGYSKKIGKDCKIQPQDQSTELPECPLNVYFRSLGIHRIVECSKYVFVHTY